MRTLHLFAGIGGGMLADLILGHKPVCAVEIDPYCCAVLRERRDDGWFPELHVHEGDVRLWDPSEWAGRVGCIAAGFPCQDLSCAGRGAGIGGERSGLWTEVMRAADVIRPSWIFLENVPAIRTRGGEVVLAALRGRGYRCRCGTLAAEDVGAPHRRERWWCLAERTDAESVQREENVSSLANTRNTACESSGDVPNTDVGSLDGGREQCAKVGEGTRRSSLRSPQSDLGLLVDEFPAEVDGDRKPASDSTLERTQGETQGWWSVEPDIGRTAVNVRGRIHMLRGLGNAQVPLQAALAWILLGGPVA